MKKQLILTAGLGALIILILGAVLILLRTDILKKADRINEIKKELGFRSTIIKSLSTMRNDINLIQPYVFGLDNVLPTKDQLINFSKDLNMMAAQNKINLASNFSGENVESSKGLKWIGLTATAEGNFSDLINFLKAIENSRYSVKLDNIDTNEKDGKYKMFLNGKVFYF